MAQKGTKKIDTWELSKDGRTVSIDVYLHRETSASGTNSPRSATFRAKCLELQLTAEHPNIDELQTTIFAKIRELLSIEYFSHFVVEVKGSARLPNAGDLEHSINANLEFKVERILLSADRKLYQRPGSSASNPFNKQLGGRGSGLSSYDPDVRALLPDTPEIRAGLFRIVEGFAELKKRLLEVCDVDKIEQNLQIIGAPGGNLLTAGTPAKEGE